MKFSKGQTVVHPHHGPAVVSRITSRRVQRTAVKYYDLEVIKSNLHVSIPVDRAEEMRLRPILTRTEIEQVLDVLRARSAPEVDQWSRRIKENRDRLNNGDIFEHAAIARDLGRRDERKRLSFAERQMLREAREPIVVEVAIALGMSIEEADALLKQAEVSGALIAA
ncbi:MAG: hypothetical protein IR160_04015 [Salinibacterium sp.]|nr:CarD family transcriptional regulator [Salinibacterium sp.]MBF0671733.1 hypothetical protein [Salinibacterium sp.]